MAQFYDVPYVDVDFKENIFVMMEDGTKIEFFQPVGAKNSILLVPSDYINISDANSIMLSDGTEVFVPHA